MAARFALSSIVFADAVTRKPNANQPRLCQDSFKRWIRFGGTGALRRGQPMKLTGGLLLVLLFAVSLAGCIHETGPCYGVGCRAFTSPPASQPTPAQAAATQPGSKSAKKSHRFSKMLKKVKL
jgi:hypothetical protein